MSQTHEKLPPAWPGRVLLNEFMLPLGISQNKLARDIDVPPTRINQIIQGKRTITADTALRLAEYFGTSPELWLNMQQSYDLRIAKRDSWPEIQPRIRHLGAENSHHL